MTRTIFTLTLLVGLLIQISCVEMDTSPHQIKYEVTVTNTNGGVGFASLTYSNESGGTSQETKALLPWVKTFTAKKGAFLYISAQNNYSGVITTNIYVDGRIVKTSNSSGEFAIATANGSL